MMRTYSKRLLSPFVGLVQVAETPRARAVSLDGKNWAIQYSLKEHPELQKASSDAGLYAQFVLVATIESGELKTRGLHPFLDPEAVKPAIDAFFEVVPHAQLPFAAADRYEYWLLDGTDGAPLALLHSCVDEEDMTLYPRRPSWIAMPAAQLEVPAPEESHATYVPPVNYRLQKLVEKRAGVKPRSTWFDRSRPAREDFPPCLIRDAWENEDQQGLCDRYIQRLAPRLLMLQGLPLSVRQRLELAARDHVFDVERFYPLYPEVIDKGLLTAARVEAQFRRAAVV